ncbi:F-box/WD repeat-containing protein 9 [Elysia marginata]|uniref:F-box/WD repeat-containing protein 9 n=1 Tax=Elysia marginata TaxID=1093978 RepID=A0AAV4I5F9_9GAST|nr:F-box/WD repeat-containing protein 9 [Elysia marginata]
MEPCNVDIDSNHGIPYPSPLNDEEKVFRGCCSRMTKKSVSRLDSESDLNNAALPFNNHETGNDVTASSQSNLLGRNHFTDQDTESCLPISVKQEDDDIGDPEMWDGLVPIEVKADTDDEDYVCEFCSPRLGGANQISKRNEEPITSDDEFEIEGELTLGQLNDDALFHIAKFLESRTIRFSLSSVNKRFYALFNRDSSFWKVRYATQIGNKCRCPTAKMDFDLADKCLAWDDIHRVWENPETQTHHFAYSYHIMGGVDAVHLMNKGQLAVTGDRNRQMNLIDLTKYPGPEADPGQTKDLLKYTDATTHKGWIWTLDSVDNMIFTGAWDMHIRQFDAAVGCRVVQDYKCQSAVAVLSLYAEENHIFAGCFNKKLYCIDRRTSEIKQRAFHKRAVVCVTGNDKYIISGSEDKRISIFDRRADKIFKMLKLESLPLCLSYHDNQLWFGDRTGTLHLHDGTDGSFKHIGSYDIGHTKRLLGVINTSGAVFTCSGDGTVKVLEPTRDPVVVASLKSHKKEVADVAYSHGVLASGGDDGISLWLPKHWDRNTYLL